MFVKEKNGQNTYKVIVMKDSVSNLDEKRPSHKYTESQFLREIQLEPFEENPEIQITPLKMHPHYPTQKHKIKKHSEENSLDLRGSTPHTIVVGQNSLQNNQNDDLYQGTLQKNEEDVGLISSS